MTFGQFERIAAMFLCSLFDWFLGIFSCYYVRRHEQKKESPLLPVLSSSFILTQTYQFDHSTTAWAETGLEKKENHGGKYEQLPVTRNSF